jgi:hypothetical protein
MFIGDVPSQGQVPGGDAQQVKPMSPSALASPEIPARRDAAKSKV